METIKVPGAVVFEELARLRKEWPQTKRYPFIIGSDEDLESLRDLSEPPKDNGESIIQEALSFDVAGWLAENAPKRKACWPKQGLPALDGIISVNDVLSGERKPEINIGLVEATNDSHVFARLGYGGWNDCPPPHIHVALHQYWDKKYKTSLTYLSGDTVEFFVRQPAVDKKAALALANEHHSYCYDVVEQGVGTIGKLASTLLEAKYWYFWWD